jgi:hypothetical protein
MDWVRVAKAKTHHSQHCGLATRIHTCCWPVMASVVWLRLSGVDERHAGPAMYGSGWTPRQVANKAMAGLAVCASSAKAG